MKLQFIFGLLPAIVVHVDTLGDWKAGEARGPLVRIVRSHADDVGLLQHELVHVAQWYAGLGIVLVVVALAAFACPDMARPDMAQNLAQNLAPVAVFAAMSAHGVLYKLSRRYRQWAEVRAYRVQAGYCSPQGVRQLAQHLAWRYGLPLTEAQALALLRPAEALP